MGTLNEKDAPGELDFLNSFVGSEPGTDDATETAAQATEQGYQKADMGLDFLENIVSGDLDTIEQDFNDAIKEKGAPKAAVKKTPKQMEAKGGTLVSDSAAGLYVETVDLVLGIVCQMVSGAESSKPYEIPSDKKEQYQRIATTYFDSINYEANPGTFFLFATIVILAGPVWKAYNDRKERVKMSAYNSARSRIRETAAQNTIPGQQTSFFDTKDMEALKNAPKRKRFEFDDDGFYTYSAPEAGSSEYLKKELRTEAVPGNIATFVRNFEGSHGRKPTNKEITTYLMSV